MHKTVTGNYRGDKLAFKIAQPVQELLNDPSGAGVPDQAWRDLAADTYSSGEHFADYYPGQDGLLGTLRNRKNYGIIRLPECDPIGYYEKGGKPHYVVGNLGYERFDSALLCAMAVHQGMNVNDVTRFVRFTRSILRVEGGVWADVPAEPLQ